MQDYDMIYLAKILPSRNSSGANNVSNETFKNILNDNEEYSSKYDSDFDASSIGEKVLHFCYSNNEDVLRELISDYRNNNESASRRSSKFDDSISANSGISVLLISMPNSRFEFYLNQNCLAINPQENQDIDIISGDCVVDKNTLYGCSRFPSTSVAVYSLKSFLKEPSISDKFIANNYNNNDGGGYFVNYKGSSKNRSGNSSGGEGMGGM